MKLKNLIRIAVAVCAGLYLLNVAHAQNTVFTYQGRVLDGGTNFNGAGQFKFALVTSTNTTRQAKGTANTPSGGYITGYAVTDGGSGYTTVPTVTVSGGGGSGAAATASINGGAVTVLSVVNPGNGQYTNPPTVTIAPPSSNLSYTTYWSNDGTSSAGGEPTAAVSIAVNNGLFTVILGDTTLANMQAIDATLFSQPKLQLRIWFNDGVNGFAPLNPVHDLTPAPYAISAASAAIATTATSATTATIANTFSGSLSGNVTGTQSATVVATVGGQSAASVASGASAANAATAANSANTIVKRDGSGNFAAGNITGTFIGDGNGLTNLSVNALTNLPGTLAFQIVSGTSQPAQPNTRYLFTNSALVTVTLPASANLNTGDIVRISSTGAGGWKIVQNAGQSIASGNLAGTAGISWSGHDSLRDWHSVASSSDGTKLVAVVNNGPIFTSTDSGATWTQRDTTRGWVSVASSSDGSKLVATVSGGQIYISSDSGQTWTPHDSSRNWNSVASSADGTRLLAAVSSGQLYISTDSGATWSPRDSNRNWFSVASSADGTKLVASVYNGQIYTSTDSGSTWTPRDSNRAWFALASSSDGTKLVAAVLTGQIYTSTDSGATWVPRDSSRGWYSVASSADGTKLVAVVPNGLVYTSTDSGATWTPRDFPRGWYSVASSSDGTKLVAALTNDRIFTSTPSSVSSTTVGTAGYLQGGQNAAIELQYVGNGQFLPISYAGAILVN